MRVLDLFCGAGGASMGYYRAGFEVVGVDIKPQPRYPFPFIQGDALEALGWAWVKGFDLIHASPPCQRYSITANAHNREHPDLVPPTLERLEALGIPWVVENVPGAPLPDPIILCGSMYGLVAEDHYLGQPVQLRRHRLFSSNLPLVPRGECQHVKGMRVGGVYGGAWSKNRTIDPTVKRTGGYAPPDDVQRALMGIGWMRRQELNQAIPPDYTLWIGRQAQALLWQ